jgi:sporulation protein YlmC with PRC-barrel domain
MKNGCENMQLDEFQEREMSNRELHLELLLGKQVWDCEGQYVGRIEEICAQQRGNDWVIQEYLVGSTALLERLSAWKIGLGLLKLMGARKIYGGYRIPWEQLNLSNPDRPSLRCTRADLKSLNEQLQHVEQP